MDEITPQVFASVSNSEVNTVVSATCDERVDIKQEYQDVNEEHFEIESTMSTASVISVGFIYSILKMSSNKLSNFLKT